MSYVDTPPVLTGLGDDEVVLPPSRSRRLGPATIGLALTAVACLGFAVGVSIEKRQLPTTTAASTNRAGLGGTGNGRTTTTLAGGAGAGGAAGGAGFGGGGGAVIGQVTSVDGTTLVVTETGGNTVKVVASTDTAVTRSESGGVSDIKSGDYVTVQGTTASDGSTTAARIVDSGTTPPAAGGRGGFGGAGAAGAGAGSGTAGAGAGSGTAGANGGTGAGTGAGGTGGGGFRRPTTTTP